MLDRFFRLRENNTTVRTEFLAGLTTFLTMAYIIFVQPAVLSGAMFGMETGMDFGAVFVATCLAAAVGSLIMGLAQVAELLLERIVLVWPDAEPARGDHADEVPVANANSDGLTSRVGPPHRVAAARRRGWPARGDRSPAAPAPHRPSGRLGTDRRLALVHARARLRGAGLSYGRRRHRKRCE